MEQENKATYRDDVEPGYWERLEKQVAEAQADIAAGRVYTKEEVIQYVRNGLYEAILRNEKRAA